MEFRIESDTMGEVKVPKDKYYGANIRKINLVNKVFLQNFDY